MVQNSKGTKRQEGKVSLPPYFSATQLFSLYQSMLLTLLYARNNISWMPFFLGICESVFSSMNTPLCILTSLLWMDTVTNFLPLEAVLRRLSLNTQHLCSGARRAVWYIIHFPVWWSCSHHVILHMYGKRQSSIISSPFPLIIKPYMATSVYPLPTDPQKQERGISSALCHLPPHGLLISLPVFKANWTKWKALESTGNEDELFQKQQIAQIHYFFPACYMHADWKYQQRRSEKTMKEKRGLIINKKKFMWPLESRMWAFKKI